MDIQGTQRGQQDMATGVDIGITMVQGKLPFRQKVTFGITVSGQASATVATENLSRTARQDWRVSGVILMLISQATTLPLQI